MAGQGNVEAQNALRLKAEMARAGRTTVTTNLPPQEKAFDVEMGKKLADAYTSIQKDAGAARGTINNLKAFSSLISNSKTGFLTPTLMKGSNVLASLGISIDPRLGDKQAADAISNQLALQIRNTTEGGGMPGAMSDADREFLFNSVPNLTKTPDGNKKLTDALIKLHQRKIETSNMATQYIKRNRVLDAGFYSEIQDYADKNPLFGKDNRPASPTGQAVPSGLEAEMRRRGLLK
jgi:hypothetical protein